MQALCHLVPGAEAEWCLQLSLSGDTVMGRYRFMALQTHGCERTELHSTWRRGSKANEIKHFHGKGLNLVYDFCISSCPLKLPKVSMWYFQGRANWICLEITHFLTKHLPSERSLQSASPISFEANLDSYFYFFPFHSVLNSSVSLRSPPSCAAFHTLKKWFTFMAMILPAKPFP